MKYILVWNGCNIGDWTEDVKSLFRLQESEHSDCIIEDEEGNWVTPEGVIHQPGCSLDEFRTCKNGNHSRTRGRVFRNN
jgi:hypothetical protein